MLNFLGQLNHFPSSGKNRFIALFLPELNVEVAIGKMALNKARLPL
jgi:hypothetical protein